MSGGHLIWGDSWSSDSSTLLPVFAFPGIRTLFVSFQCLPPLNSPLGHQLAAFSAASCPLGHKCTACQMLLVRAQARCLPAACPLRHNRTACQMRLVRVQARCLPAWAQPHCLPEIARLDLLESFVKKKRSREHFFREIARFASSIKFCEEKMFT